MPRNLYESHGSGLSTRYSYQTLADTRYLSLSELSSRKIRRYEKDRAGLGGRHLLGLGTSQTRPAEGPVPE